MNWYDPFIPGRVSSTALKKYSGTGTATDVPEGPGLIERVFSGVGRVVGKTTAETIKPIFPMLLITVGVAVAIYAYVKR